MSAVIINLDDHRRVVPALLFCHFCHSRGAAMVVPGRQYYPCAGVLLSCEEIAAVPERMLGRARP